VEAEFSRELCTTEPHPLLADKLRLFGQFVGSWQLEWHGKSNDGEDLVVEGSLVFGWILGGRAIQDVWRVPANADDRNRMRAFHGTTVRFYDPAIDAWRSTWLDPLNGRVRRFVGKPVHGGILLDGLDDTPRERWRFDQITRSNFRWSASESTDGGKTWISSEEMYARRR
jgi:hypothetical protein